MSYSTVPPPPYLSPIIPTEAIENIVDLVDDVPSLLHLCTSSRHLLPRSRFRLLSTIHMGSRAQCDKLRTFLDQRAILKSFVRSISIVPDAATSVLSVLSSVLCLAQGMPNLRELHCSTLERDFVHLSFHSTHTMLIKLYCVVEELHLGPLAFRSCAELTRLLASFSGRLRFLECTGISILAKNVDVNTILKRHTRDAFALRNLAASIHL